MAQYSRRSLIGCCGLLIAFVAMTVAGRAAFAQQQNGVDGVFAKAAELAQQRTVKVYGGGVRRVIGYGTGIIVSPNGEILVAQGAQLSAASLRVTLANGQTYPAQVARRSAPLQAAILKIEASTPDYFDLSKPSEVGPGDWILAVSNAFKVAEGTEPLSLNVGVFALRTQLQGRRGVQDVPYVGDLILLDAITSNPGAAGGAVVDDEGKLVGMIGRLIEDTGTNTRINYAAPVDRLAKFVAGVEESALADNGTPDANATAGSPNGSPSNRPVDLGIRLFRLGGRKGAAYVDRVLPNSPAAVAGVRPDDLILAVNGQTIRTSDEYQKAIAALPAGSDPVLDVKRKDQVLTLRLSAPDREKKTP
jgi:serine protease Do